VSLTLRKPMTSPVEVRVELSFEIQF
jgi:hypothetical protein